jgi:hypothetical protein
LLSPPADGLVGGEGLCQVGVAHGPAGGIEGSSTIVMHMFNLRDSFREPPVLVFMWPYAVRDSSFCELPALVFMWPYAVRES